MNRQQRRAAERLMQKSPPAFGPRTREDLARAAMRADQIGQVGVAELLREAMRGNFAVAWVTDRAAIVTEAEIAVTNRPTVLLVGDDDYRSSGPSGWRCTAALVAWARCAIIHAAGATAESYREAANGARLTGRAVLIETDSAHADAWAALFIDVPRLLIWPTDGAHPILPPRSSMQ